MSDDALSKLSNVLLKKYSPSEEEGNKLVLIVTDDDVTILDYMKKPACCSVVANEESLITKLLTLVCSQLAYTTVVIVDANTNEETVLKQFN